MTWAMRYVKAAPAGVVSQLTPTSAMLLGVLWFGEPARWQALVGAAVTLGGVALGARAESRSVDDGR
jgi:drug/metabolite transporter (DMT)-like permease